MIESLPSATFHAYLQGAPSGLTGTLGVKVTDPSGSVVTARTTSGIAEIATGIYHKLLTAPAPNGRYLVIWDSGSTVISEELLVGATTQQIADSIYSTQTTIVSGVQSGGDIVFIRGDDYLARDGRRFEWTDSSWPDLAGASIVFTSRTTDEDVAVSKAGTVITPSGSGKRIGVELTAAETAAHLTREYLFDIRATLSNGDKVTLVQARIDVHEDVHP